MSEKIPAAIIRLLQEADFTSVATSDINGQPSAADKFLLKVESNILYIIDFVRGKTWENLRRNPYVSVTVMDKGNLRNYQVNGSAEILEKGGEYDRLREEFSEKQIRFATNRIIEGVRRIKEHDSFTLPFSKEVIVLKVRVAEVLEIGPAAEIKKQAEATWQREGLAFVEIKNRFLKKLTLVFAKRPRLAWFVSIPLLAFIGFIDYATGYEIGVSIFYLIPIILVAWTLSWRDGFLISALSTLVWILAEELARKGTLSHIVIAWNSNIRFAFFLTIVTLMASLKKKLEQEEKLANNDFLTGAANSRYFFELADRELKRMLREKRPMTLAYLDVDNFKAVNDTHGHPAGDSLLRLIAEIIKGSVREIDIVSRLGGDEFAILMPMTGYEESRIALRRIKERLSAGVRQGGFPVTFSIGGVTYLSPPATIEEAVSRADDQMYVAKKNGKNAVSHNLWGNA